MGGSLVRGMLASGITTEEKITLSSRTPESAASSAQSLGVIAAASNAEAIRKASVLFLCVKPSQSLALLSGIAADLSGKLLISVVAGIHAEDLFRAAGGNARVIRSMPNTAVRIRKGITAIAPHASAT